MEWQATPVFAKQVKAYEDGYNIIVHQGGSRSSKTYSILQFLLMHALMGDKWVITICRDRLTWVKSTLLVDFKNITQQYNIPVVPDINPQRQDQVYDVCGTEFAFFGLDYTEKLHGRSQDVFWINEAISVKRADFDQLEMRNRKFGILDYNPTEYDSWIYDLAKRDDVKFIKSTLLDNPFLPDTIINKIKSYEPTEENIQKGTADNYMWEVYGLGNKARLQNTVFTKWNVIDKLPEDEEGNLIPRFLGYGLDFGYTNDPTAIVALYKQDNEPYFDEVVYEKGLTNQDICDKLRELGVKNTDDIYADSAEPKSIEEIRRGGFNIMPTNKGSDSIRYGISLLQQTPIHITKNSIHLEEELRKYKYKEDRNGNVLNEPIDAFNHAIDACRYVSIMKLGNVPTIQIINRGLI